MPNKYMKRYSISLDIKEMQTIEMQIKWNSEMLFHTHTQMVRRAGGGGESINIKW